MDARSRLDALYAQGTSAVSVPERKAVRLVETPALFTASLTAPERLLSAHNAELLLFLYVEQIGDFLVVDLWSKQAGAAGVSLVGSVAAPEAEIGVVFEQLWPALMISVSGTVPATLVVAAVDELNRPVEAAEIFLDDRLIGAGRATVEGLAPGSYRVRVRGGGGVQRISDLTLSAGERREVQVALPRPAEDMIMLTSDPSGAEVYRGSRFVGFTPLFVQRPVNDQVYTFSAQGYYDSRAMIGTAAPEAVHRILVGEATQWERELSDSRRAFYRSFGWFALSLAVPVTLYGVYQDYGGLFPGGNARPQLADPDAVLSRANAVLYSYYGSIVVSGTLLVNTISKLVDYIRTGQGYHVR